MPPVPHSYTSALHVHTDMSESGGTLDSVLEAARAMNISIVVLADHSTRGYANEGMEGWHDGVLVLCAEEVCTAEGHFLSFESPVELGQPGTLEEATKASRTSGGTVVSVHHQLPVVAAPRLAPEKSDILEIWSFMDDFLSQTRGATILQDLDRATRLLKGPSRRDLRQWDHELTRRMLPIVGGLNVHERKEPLLEWRSVFPYMIAFKTVVTVIQAPELPKISSRACALVWNALRQGRSYVVNRDVATERGFHFEYTPPHGRSYAMGENAPYTPGGHFRIVLPHEAEIVLRHNSQPLFWGTGSLIRFPAASPGSYRVEVFLNRRLWVLSNPIRLVDDDGGLHPTVSDVT